MPIKLPKSFARRKSSGNVLEDVEAPQSSFRVFERPGPQRSMTDGAALSKHHSEGSAVPSALDDSDNMFAERPLDKRYERPSTMDSLKRRLTGNRESGHYESSTSTRLSSSSTIPSSTEVPPENTQSPHSRIQDVPAPPPLTSALRAAGRTLSFGGRFGKSAAAIPRQQTPETAKRPVTGSTDSTATPPKLPDTTFSMESQDDFNKMFDNMGGSSVRERSPQPRQVRIAMAPGLLH